MLRLQCPMPSRLPVVFIVALAITARFNALAVPSPPLPLPPHGLGFSSHLIASVMHDASQWIPWFDLGVEALSSDNPLLASRMFLLSARVSGNPAAWSNAGFAITKMKGGPHLHMLHAFAAAFRASRDQSAAVFLAQAMVLLDMQHRALEFMTFYLARRCGSSSSNCVWRSGVPKLLLHTGAAVNATADLCVMSTCSGRGAGSVVVMWFDMLQQTCSRWQTRQQDVAFFHRFIDDEMRLNGSSSVPDQDSLRMLLPPMMRLQINRFHALSQQQPGRLIFYPPSRTIASVAPPIMSIAYFSLQFSPRNSLNGLPSGIFRRAFPYFMPHPSSSPDSPPFHSTTLFSIPPHYAPSFTQAPRPQACEAALRRHQRLQCRCHPLLPSFIVLFLDISGGLWLILAMQTILMQNVRCGCRSVMRRTKRGAWTTLQLPP